jgi:hypothetical protein
MLVVKELPLELARTYVLNSIEEKNFFLASVIKCAIRSSAEGKPYHTGGGVQFSSLAQAFCALKRLKHFLPAPPFNRDLIVNPECRSEPWIRSAFCSQTFRASPGFSPPSTGFQIVNPELLQSRPKFQM